jgi:hypothetical protein
MSLKFGFFRSGEWVVSEDNPGVYENYIVGHTFPEDVYTPFFQNLKSTGANENVALLMFGGMYEKMAEKGWIPPGTTVNI